MFYYIYFTLYFLCSACVAGILFRKLEEKHLWWVILASMIVFMSALFFEPTSALDALCETRR